MTLSTSNTLDSYYSPFPSPEEQEDPLKYPLSGIILNNPSYMDYLKRTIHDLKKPDEDIWDNICIREIEPGALTCQLLEQAYKIQSLNRWAQNKIPLEWLSKDNPVGRASRMLLEKEFDESRFQDWLKTGPSNDHILLIMRSEDLKGKQYSAKTLELLKKLPIEFLSTQSLAHFPWHRLLGLTKAKSQDIVQSLRKKLMRFSVLPEGFERDAYNAKSSKERMLFIELCVGINQPALLTLANHLLATEMLTSKVSKETIKSHLNTLLGCAEISLNDLDLCSKLLLHPSIQLQAQELKAYFDRFLDHLLTSFASDAALQQKAIGIYNALSSSFHTEANNSPSIDLVRKIQPETRYLLNVHSFSTSALEVIYAYTANEPWFNLSAFTEKLRACSTQHSTNSVQLTFDSKNHLSLLKQYILKLCSFKSTSEQMQWFISLFAIHSLHQFIASHRSESSFVDSMMEEIILHSTFRKNPHQFILEKALNALPAEKAIAAPRIKWLQSLFCEQVIAPSLTHQSILTVIYKLMDNPDIGAVNEALNLSRTYQEKISGAEVAPIRAQIAERLKNYFTHISKTEIEIHSFCMEFPLLALFMLKNTIEIPVEKLTFLKNGLVNVLQEILPLEFYIPSNGTYNNLQLVLQGLECLKSSIDKDNKIKKLLKDLAESLYSCLLKNLQVIQKVEASDHLHHITELCRRFLRNLPIAQYCPQTPCDIWLSVRLILLRTLLTDESNQQRNERELLSFYKESNPEIFHHSDPEYREKADSQFIELKPLFNLTVVQAHENFVNKIHPQLNPEEIQCRIEKLSTPDDSLIHAIINSKDEDILLQLASKALNLKQPLFLNWLLDHLSHRLNGDDSLGSLLRSECKGSAPNKELENHLLQWIKQGPLLPHVLEVLSDHIYPDSFLEELQKLLYKSSTTASVRNRFFTFCFKQNLKYFPWGWCSRQMPADEILAPLAIQLAKLNTLPSTLTDYFAKSAELKSWLAKLELPSFLLYELSLLEQEVKKQSKRAPLDLIKDQINRILSAPHSNCDLINAGLRLLLHPSVNKLSDHLTLFSKLLDLGFKKIFISHPGFKSVCKKMAHLESLFKFSSSNGEAFPFTHQPYKQISLQQVLVDAEQAFFHYYLPNIVLPPDQLDEIKAHLNKAPPQWRSDSISLEFDPNIHEELEWIFLQKLIHLRPENEDEQFVLAFYARAWLHQYALNHAPKNRERIEWANDQIYFLSKLQPGGSIDVARVAHTSFPIEKQLYKRQSGGVLKRQFLIQDLVNGTPAELEDFHQPHTEQLHRIFMQMIKTGTPDSLEAVSRIRHYLHIEKVDRKKWDIENQATNEAFIKFIVPLMREGNIQPLFNHRPHLLELAIQNPHPYSQALVELIHFRIQDCPVDKLESSLKQLFSLSKAESTVKTSKCFMESITSIALKMLITSQDEYSTFRSLHSLVHTAPVLIEVSPPLFSRAYGALTALLVAKALEPKPSASQFHRRLLDHLDKANIPALKSSIDFIESIVSEFLPALAGLPSAQEKLKELMKQLKA